MKLTKYKSFSISQKEQMIFEQKAKDYDRDLQIIKRAIEEKLKLHDRLNNLLAKLIEMTGGNEDDPLQQKVRISKKRNANRIASNVKPRLKTAFC